MLDFPRWKVWLVTLSLIAGIWYAIPSFLPESIDRQMPAWLSPQVNLGLDLAGGSELLLEAQTADVGRLRLEAMEEIVSREMRTASPRIRIGEVSTAGGQLSFLVRDARQVDAAREIVYNLTQPTGFSGQRDWAVNVVDSTRIVLRPTEAGLNAAIDEAMNTARDVIDRRINALGTLEPTIIRQGTDRIIVQVPGLQDPEALKALIGRTARLEFKLVDLTATPEQLQSNRAPVGSQILPYAEGGEGARIAVQRRAIITGDQISDARQGFDQTDGRPVVNITFDGTGSQRFARVTRENVGRPFAIILDNVVISAPNINEPILGGQAQISGSFTEESARQLAILLNRPLPIPVRVIEERAISN